MLSRLAIVFVLIPVKSVHLGNSFLHITLGWYFCHQLEIIGGPAITKYTPVKGLTLYVCKYQQITYLFAFWIFIKIRQWFYTFKERHHHFDRPIFSVSSSFIYYKYNDNVLCVKVACICCNLHLKLQKHCLIWLVTCSLSKIAECT